MNLYFSFLAVPETNEDLPDLYGTLQSLDTDDIELNLKTSPPSILTNDQQQEYQKQVHDLKQGIATDFHSILHRDSSATNTYFTLKTSFCKILNHSLKLTSMVLIFLLIKH